MTQRVGWLFLVIAGSGAALYVIRATRFGEIFTDWTRQAPEALLLALPLHLAILGMVLPAIPISLLLDRGRFGPKPLRAAALVTAIFGAVVVVLMIVAAYDSMWALYMGTARLDAPPVRRLLPPEVLPVTFALGAALMGGWMELTSIQVWASGVSRVLSVLGAVTGAAIVATMPYAWNQFAGETLLPMELTLSMLWAGGLGIYLLFVRRATAMA